MTILNASLVALTTWIRRKKCDESEFCDRILPEVMEQTGWKVSNQPSPLSGHIKNVKKGGKYFYFSRLECNQVSKYSYLRSFLKEGPSSRYLSLPIESFGMKKFHSNSLDIDFRSREKCALLCSLWLFTRDMNRQASFFSLILNISYSQFFLFTEFFWA